ncbi:MAG: hypothetical protein ACRD7E_21535 [Bryobacteraceae bacterium]
MDQRSDQIVEHIEQERSRLGHNLEELEGRVKTATDWRTHFNRHPFVFLGLAMGGGILLSGVVTGSSGSRSSSSAAWRHRTGSRARFSGPATSQQRQKAAETLDVVRGALIAFGTQKLKEFMSQSLPGFDQYFEQAERQRASGRVDTESRSEPMTGQSREETRPHPPSGMSM